jgi:cell division protease FtsH
MASFFSENENPGNLDGLQKKQKSSQQRQKRKNPLPSKNDDDMNWNKILKIILGWSALIMAMFFIMTFLRGTNGTEHRITYLQYEAFLGGNKIEKAVIKKSDFNNVEFHGTLKQPEIVRIDGKDVKVEKFIILLPYIDADMVKSWTDRTVVFTIEKEDSLWLNALINILPWVLLIGIWFVFMKRMQGGGNKGIFNFGQSKAKLINDGQGKITFKDVAGADEAKVELQEVIEFLKEPRKFQKLGGKIPKGVLLLGPPGTGKTLLARAVAGEAEVPFFSISGADFVEMFVGVGASRVRDLFLQGKKNAPCIVFIDEIDAVGRHRGSGLGGGHDEREQTLNQLLVEMDGFEQNMGVIIIAATNRPDVLDPALLRPGRFDRQIVVDRPDVRGREGIIKVHTAKIPLAEDVDIYVIAKGTPGLAGAELANLVNEAALLAARKNKVKVEMIDFEEAKDKVMMGVERKSLIISDTEKKITAYHESGHVLVAKKIPESDPVHKVTIIPRGRALGVTTYLPMDEKHTYSKGYLEAMITYALGGRVAEKLIFDQFTTGAGNDIGRSTDLARKMVCEWGMSEKLGPLSYGSKEEELFLGREITKHSKYSEKIAEEIDEEVRSIIMKCHNRAETILKDNMEVLHKLAVTLLEHEILDGEDIDKIIRGEELPPPVDRNKQQEKLNFSSRAEEIRKAVEEIKKADEEKEKLNEENDGSLSEKNNEKTD